VLNLEPENKDGRTSVHAWRSGAWEAIGHADVAQDGSALMLSLPRDLLPDSGASPRFDFKWADNIQSFGGIEVLGVNGDSAPNRRFNYRYGTETAEGSVSAGSG